MKEIPMPPITLNGVTCNAMVITHSGRKWWRKRSKEIYGYIFSSLDGQDRKLDEHDPKTKEPLYHLASNTMADPNAPWMEKAYRDTIYKIRGPVIWFFHGCPRNERWYHSKSKTWKTRQE